MFNPCQLNTSDIPSGLKPNKKGLSRHPVCQTLVIFWCRRSESNRHGVAPAGVKFQCAPYAPISHDLQGRKFVYLWLTFRILIVILSTKVVRLD